MKNNKVKDYLKEHKKEIAIGVLCGVGGCVIGGALMKHSLASKLKALDIFKEFDNGFLEDVIKVAKDCNHSDVFKCGDGTVLEDVRELVAEYYAGEGISPETPLTGLVTFIKK